jgi:uncharacterized membrane protein HdeD (DUF308 family)
MTGEKPMSAATTTTDPPSPNGQAAGVLIAEGAVLILLGMAAAAFPAFASIAAAVLLGWILIACGIAGLVSAFSARPHVHFIWSLFSSIVSLVAGFLVAYHPLVGVFTLVVLLAAWLALDGFGSLMVALSLRKSGGRGWLWLLVSAIIDWVLAIALLALSPVGGLFAIGIIVGLDLFLGGWALIMLGLGRRRVALTSH